MTIQEAYDYGWREPEATKFVEWHNRVDAWLLKLCGMSSGDLPDVDYATFFRQEYTPAETAREVLSEALYY